MTVAEVNAVARAFHDGVANRDATALASLYSEEGRFLPPNMEPCEGPAAIQAAMQGLLDMGARSLDIEPLEVRCGCATACVDGEQRSEPPGVVFERFDPQKFEAAAGKRA